MSTPTGGLALLFSGWLLAATVMAVLWAIQRRTRNATAVDVAWAANLGLLAALYAVAADGLPLRRALLALVAGAWSLRLASHLLVDRVLGRAEDGRYERLRKEWGARADARFFVFYQFQALLDAVLSVPFLLVCRNAAPQLHPFEFAGAGLLAAALAGESLADAQLQRHRSEPANKGKTCRSGLWRYSRHPNYFFEWLNWCGFALMAWSAPFGWLGLLSPLLMLVFILKVTGIPPTEAQAVLSRGEDYRRYQRTTSAFLPWFPKSGGGSG